MHERAGVRARISQMMFVVYWASFLSFGASIISFHLRRPSSGHRAFDVVCDAASALGAAFVRLSPKTGSRRSCDV
uniref:Putative secreted peptide n=1 Tax=Anopheles braziliensis TaxID=58242 RepID=A0A2M3ZRX9_9DIPT